MRKKYLVPETEVTLVTIETNILSNWNSSSADMTVDEDTYKDIVWDY